MSGCAQGGDICRGYYKRAAHVLGCDGCTFGSAGPLLVDRGKGELVDAEITSFGLGCVHADVNNCQMGEETDQAI